MKKPIVKLWQRFQRFTLTQKLSYLAAALTLLIFVVLAISSVWLQNAVRQDSFDVRRQASVTDQCPAPSSLRASLLTCNLDELVNLKVAWDSVSGATQYRLDLSTNSDFSGETPEASISSLTSETQFSYQDIAPGKWYLRVKVSESSSCTPDAAWSYLAVENNCENPQPQCYYQYSSWSECVNGWQTRSYQTKPDNCAWHESEILEELSRYCGPGNQPKDLMVYNYESCWSDLSGGATTYILWNNQAFENAAWLDISPFTDFKDFAHKQIETIWTYQTNEASYSVTDATNLVWAHDDQTSFKLEPEQTYYIRLYNGSHSAVTSFYMPACEPGQGGASYKTCNQSCQNNHECASNLACFQGACRLVTNLTSPVCAPQTNQEFIRTCNEYCADNRECSASLTCWWNRCRRPDNLESLECLAPATQTSTITTYTASTSDISVSGCNQSCTSNRDCAANLRCYQGVCRLAINPKSSQCQAKSQASLEKKGGEKTDETEDTGATTSALLSPSPSLGVEPVDLDAVNQISQKPVSEQTALDALVDALKEYSSQLNLNLPVLTGISLGLVALLVLIIWLRRRSQRAKLAPPAPAAPPRPGQPFRPATTPETTSQELPLSKPSRQAQSSQFGEPLPDYQRPASQPPTQQTQTSKMMERMRAKGIQPPEKKES